MTLLLALVPAAIALYIFHATCRMRSPKADSQLRRGPFGDHTPPPPNYGRVA